jgi:hypothetical protein
MVTLRDVHQMMNERCEVLLSDGRVGRVVRVDTLFPSNATTVTVWTSSGDNPGITKVMLGDLIGQAQANSA